MDAVFASVKSKQAVSGGPYENMEGKTPPYGNHGNDGGPDYAAALIRPKDMDISFPCHRVWM